jgi:hypothetical protein
MENRKRIMGLTLFRQPLSIFWHFTRGLKFILLKKNFLSTTEPNERNESQSHLLHL